jgi:hypothetical protein
MFTRVDIFAGAAILNLGEVIDKLVGYVREVVMEKLESYEEEEDLNFSLKERVDELVRPILDCLSLLERIVRVKELVDMRDERSEEVTHVAYAFLQLDDEGFEKAKELIENEWKRVIEERKKKRAEAIIYEEDDTTLQCYKD